MSFLVIEDLHKTFRLQNGTPLPVLGGVSFSVEEREFCCLLGPSGCGKSTVLNILAGLMTTDGGKVTVGGKSLEVSPVRTGYVFQKSRLLNWRTVRENLHFAMEARQIPRSQWADRVNRYVRLVGLEQFVEEYPLSLSGGMQQRVAIARALVIDPDILLMDEPFSHLDELTARTMRQELLRIWREDRRTVLFVTHNALEAVYLADRVHLFGTRPATIMKTVPVDIPRVRQIDDPRLIALQKEILGALGLPGN
ncbi:MAG: ABC transporter ATP-binding protein [Candidatus Tectomicrobia bacterium]|uniref:ABC transporter ATP-binding protein n=1 Tax=Tectimicrobiota bacterium TaxID=2528274 RepID=A0A932GM26_UNCTE|nr:ABC transporter ATP-binding protein [Candidatus Tectomicrobia bacterium]